MDTNTIIEGTLKFRDGKKWKSRWCVLRKLSPVADCVHVQLYRDSKDRYNNGQTKASLSLQYFSAVQSGFTLDKESNTIAILCEDVTVIFAFDTREQLIQWQAKIAINLGEDEQFVVQLVSAPARSRLAPGPARLHVLTRRFCLTDGVPPRLLGNWHIAHLRKYGAVGVNRFCFEGGSQCGRGEGVHLLLTDRAPAVAHAFEAAAQGDTPLSRRAAFRMPPVRERSISSSRTEANFCAAPLCSDPLMGERDGRSRSQENLCWSPPGADWTHEPTPSDHQCNSHRCHGVGPASGGKARCRGCHVRMARSSTVSCGPGSGFTWTMESCDPTLSSTFSLERRHRSASSSFRIGSSPGRPPPRPPKTKPCALGLSEGLPENPTGPKRPRPSPSMPLIGSCTCTPAPLMEMGEEYYDTPRSFKNAIIDHSISSGPSFPYIRPSCLCRCAMNKRPAMTHSASVSQALLVHGRESLSDFHHSQIDHSCGLGHNQRCTVQSDEPTSLSSEPGWHHDFDTHSRCRCYTNIREKNSLCRANRCVKSVTCYDLPRNKPNYVNIDFADSLKFYENCKDCYNKLFEEFEYDQERILLPERSIKNLCHSCSNYLRDLQFSSSSLGSNVSRVPPPESPGYIKMSALTNIANSESAFRVDQINNVKPNYLFRSKSAMCLHRICLSPSLLRAQSISDPEIHLLSSNIKQSKIVISKIINIIRNVRPVTAREIQRHAKRPSLPSCRIRKEESQYYSDDTLSSATMVNTTNGLSVEGSLDSVDSVAPRRVSVGKLLSSSDLNISASCLGGFKSVQMNEIESDLERFKDHLRSLEIPQLPSESELCRSDHGLSVARRSCTFNFKPGHNRDSSSSNDSGVSTASLRLRRTDFTEFEIPVTTSLSAKLLREYALGQAGKSSSDLSLPRRSKSIDPLSELVFQFQEAAAAAKSTSALLSVEGAKDSKTMRFIDAPSTSSGTSDLSDYMDNLSISSYSSNDHPRMSRCPATTLKPRSGKEYHKIDRLNLKPSDEGARRGTEGQPPA